ncbi:MAG: class I SAM-dependent methyltransferase [Caldilineaceae bacterium]
MTPAVQQRLLELNRTFYAQIAADFDQTRAGLPLGWQQLAAYLPRGTPEKPFIVLDVGCGNGRFARFLADQGSYARYVGIDGDAALLTFAAQHSADTVNLSVRFIQADLAQPDWASNLAGERFDLVVCFAVLHHLPGFALRLQLMQALAAHMATDSLLILSNWQFLTSQRFAQKQIDWQTIGLTSADVEPGDALLPWQQGGYAVRYVHQVDGLEMTRLASDTHLHIVATFLADGKEGNLNLYTILRRT